MFSNLAFIDWIALVFAAVLLAAAVAAAIVAYATAKNRPVRSSESTPPPPSHTPEHAAPGPLAPARATSERHLVAAATPAFTEFPSAVRSTAPEVVSYEKVVSGVPSPPRVESSELVDHAVVADGVRLEPSRNSSQANDRAARAQRLRKRPVPEHNGHKRVVSKADPKRTPAHAPNRAPLERTGRKLSVEGDRTEGFARRGPGFFDDPVGRHELRYWDGHRWTEYVKERGERFTDPL